MLDILLSQFGTVCCSMSSSNCCFLTCIHVSQEAGMVVRYSHLLKNFPQFLVIHTVKGFSVVNEAEVELFWNFLSFSMIQWMLAIWSLVPLPFLNPAWTSGSLSSCTVEAYLEPVCCSTSSSNCCFLTCLQISQEACQVVWYSHFFQNFPQFIVIHTVKGFGIVNKAEIDVFLELSCFFNDLESTWHSLNTAEKLPKICGYYLWKLRQSLIITGL